MWEADKVFFTAKPLDTGIRWYDVNSSLFLYFTVTPADAGAQCLICNPCDRFIPKAAGYQRPLV